MAGYFEARGRPTEAIGSGCLTGQVARATWSGHVSHEAGSRPVSPRPAKSPARGSSGPQRRQGGRAGRATLQGLEEGPPAAPDARTSLSGGSLAAEKTGPCTPLIRMLHPLAAVPQPA